MISSANLLRALESDPRTRVGGSLTNVAVSRRDASGRAELITIDGARRRTVNGWDFKIIVGHGRAPRWLAEGLALHIAGEGPMVARYLPKTDITLVDLELRLSRPASADDMRADYAAAYREVKKLIDAEGESAVWRRDRSSYCSRTS